MKRTDLFHFVGFLALFYAIDVALFLVFGWAMGDNDAATLAAMCTVLNAVREQRA